MEKAPNDPSISHLKHKFQAAKFAFRSGNYDKAVTLLDDIESFLTDSGSGHNQTHSSTDSTAYPSSDSVKYMGSNLCSGGICYMLDVSCNNIPPRSIYIRKVGADGSAGTIFLTTGGGSRMLYGSQSREQKLTVEYLKNNDYQVFELAWKHGWTKHAEGHGFKDAMCGYEEALRWAVAHLADNKNTVCAQGNSAGSFQIAYGLASYGMEDIFDAVVMSGGPPVSRLDVSCFGTKDNDLRGAEWPDGIAGRGLVDIAMGWSRAGDYCKSRQYSPEREKSLQDTSLVSPSETRDYKYKTVVIFVNSEDDYSKSDEASRIYFNKIQSEKYWYEIKGTEHNVDQTKEGASLIRDILVKKCN
jgi:hypothetical protein